MVNSSEMKKVVFFGHNLRKLPFLKIGSCRRYSNHPRFTYIESLKTR